NLHFFLPKTYIFKLPLTLSYQWLQRVLDIATKGRLPKAIKGAKAYFSVMTQGNYSDVRFGDHIMVTRADGEQFNVNELSKGTLEQLYLSLVFSMAVGFSDDYPLPIIIDDGFMSFDATRKKAAFDVMKTISKHTQVLYFSAYRDLSGNLNTIDLTRI
ncbi:MAG: DNA repair protein, partial [Lentilactobacillus hilgardii]|uniref:ATP-binding protein n=1 Tax=Lentilactobacillus hilgardii TaxID=1588 RepID=UPI0039E7E0B4